MTRNTKRLLVLGGIAGAIYLAMRSSGTAGVGGDAVGGVGTLPNTQSTYDARTVTVKPRATFADRPFGFPAQ